MRAFLRQPINWLIVFFPIALVIEHTGAAAMWVFVTAALGLVPLAAILVQATEQLAMRTGPAIGGLLNAMFGNAPELIIAFVALRAGEIALVKASLVGGMLANILFTLGLSFFVGGTAYKEQEYNARAARNQCSLLLLAALAMIVPSLFHNFITPETAPIEQQLNYTVAGVLLLAYLLSLVFMLKTHPGFFAAEGSGGHHEEPEWSQGLAIGVLLATSVALAFISEVLVGSIEETARTLGLSKAFIGIILLALIGGAAEIYAAVASARKNQMDLSIGIAIGSGLQLSMFVAPALVLVSGFLAPQPMNLVVGTVGAVLIFLSALVTLVIAGDGRSNWFKGALLICVYALIALFCYYLPDDLSRTSMQP
ncbi:MAG TPA: calcium/proton exchanger [Candidatus Polarisedimenticolia bacterium]|nr:calcium/proton exchanger [Candidatus Polarisedimenticolia bacterium]